MASLITLIALTLIFFIIRKHTGPAHLAMIAGLSVYELFATDATDWLVRTMPELNPDFVSAVLYIALVAACPLILYFRSNKGGLTGLLRLLEALLFAGLMTALISAELAHFVSFDVLSQQIANFLKEIEGTIVLVGVATAYLDILCFHRR